MARAASSPPSPVFTSRLGRRDVEQEKESGRTGRSASSSRRPSIGGQGIHGTGREGGDEGEPERAHGGGDGRGFAGLSAMMENVEAYHPSHFVRWLQRRLLQVEVIQLPSSAGDDVDLYEVLAVSPAATGADIRSAYRRMALIAHPDKPTGNKELFLDVARAYSVLGDPGKRAAYDDEQRSRTNASASPPCVVRITLRSGRDVADDMLRDCQELAVNMLHTMDGCWASTRSWAGNFVEPAEAAPIQSAWATAQATVRAATRVAAAVATFGIAAASAAAEGLWDSPPPPLLAPGRSAADEAANEAAAAGACVAAAPGAAVASRGQQPPTASVPPRGAPLRPMWGGGRPPAPPPTPPTSQPPRLPRPQRPAPANFWAWRDIKGCEPRPSPAMAAAVRGCADFL